MINPDRTPTYGKRGNDKGVVGGALPTRVPIFVWGRCLLVRVDVVLNAVCIPCVLAPWGVRASV